MDNLKILRKHLIVTKLIPGINISSFYHIEKRIHRSGFKYGLTVKI